MDQDTEVPADASSPAPGAGPSNQALPPMPPQALPPPTDLEALLRGALPHGPPPHPATGHPRQPTVRAARPSAEQIDERCWTWTSQSNARRALGREPHTTMYCYLNFRNVISDLVPVPGAPNAFLARDAPPGSPAAAEAELPIKERIASKRDAPGLLGPPAPRGTDDETPQYHWPWLDGRYLYIATGRQNIARHLQEMGGLAHDPATEPNQAEANPAPTAAAATTHEEPQAPGQEPGTGPHNSATQSPRPRRRSIPRTLDEGSLGAWAMLKRIEDRVEQAEAERAQPGKREEALMRKALGFEPKDTERLISLSDAYSSGLQRLHAHLVRIYSPGLRNLARLPETFTDGTQAQMLETVQGRLTDGSAFRLLGRMWDSLGSVYGQLEERRKRRGSGEGEGPFGGAQPPVPPGGPSGFPPVPGA